MKSNPTVLVIGGGVIGGMCAWELARAGCEVTLVERGKFGAACSHGNCGYISPSHVLPLARPGTISHTLKAMLKPNSPFAVKPRFSVEALKWFWRFARRCNQQDMREAAQGIHAILQSSLHLYQELVDQGKLQCQWQPVGNLLVFESSKNFEAYAKTDQLIRNEFGVGATRYDCDALVKLEPAIKPVVAGAWFYEVDCHLRPDLLMTSLRGNLETCGVRILENVEIKSLAKEQGSVRAAIGAGQDLVADQFVVAMGAWTPFLNRELGCQIPIQPGKGYSITMPSPNKMPRIPIIFDDTHVAITPMEDKYRIGSTMEFVGYDTSIHQKRLELLRASAQRYLHDPMCEPIEEEWFGWRPMTWDSRPIIDRSPALKNVWICAGHSMLGISTATGSGRLLRELLLGEKPHLDAQHYSMARF
jgi:D-amino-acid dehydrogenase